jgi:hypothetical protein
MLRDALESIRRQSAVDAVARIVVSENGLNEESGKVCAEFPDLPIVYLLQNPPIPALLHLKAIWHQVESPLVAILHDDDWWAPGHLISRCPGIGRAMCGDLFGFLGELWAPKFCLAEPLLYFVLARCRR